MITISSGKGASGIVTSNVMWCDLLLVASVLCFIATSIDDPHAPLFSAEGKRVVPFAASRKGLPNFSVWINPEPCSISPAGTTSALFPYASTSPPTNSTTFFPKRGPNFGAKASIIGLKFSTKPCPAYRFLITAIAAPITHLSFTCFSPQ